LTVSINDPREFKKTSNAKKQEWSLVLLVDTAVRSKTAMNCCIRMESRWNKQLLSVIARLKREILRNQQ